MMQFHITFHGPFSIGGVGPADGLDTTLDRDDLVPSTGVKGLLRAEASNPDRLGLRPALVDEVFGAAGRRPAPWWFSPVSFSRVPSLDRAARIRIDDELGTVERGFLALTEIVWADEAHFTIEPAVGVTIADDRAALHRLILRASARSVSALGGGRRRGRGWVSISDAEPWSQSDTQALFNERETS